MSVESLWLKTLMAFMGGLIVSISLVLSVFLILPGAIDIKMFIALLLGFLFWVFSMVYCLSGNNIKRSGLGLLKIFIPSVALNAVLLLLI